MSIGKGGMVRCSGFGCDETYPLEHDCMTEPGFRFGKWLGWLYLDINRPDLTSDPLKFCSVRCLRWWIEQHTPRPGGRCDCEVHP